MVKISMDEDEGPMNVPPWTRTPLNVFFKAVTAVNAGKNALVWRGGRLLEDLINFFSLKGEFSREESRTVKEAFFEERNRRWADIDRDFPRNVSADSSQDRTLE